MVYLEKIVNLLCTFSPFMVMHLEGIMTRYAFICFPFSCAFLIFFVWKLTLGTFDRKIQFPTVWQQCVCVFYMDGVHVLYVFLLLLLLFCFDDTTIFPLLYFFVGGSKS